MQRDEADHHRSERGWNPRIAHVGNVLLAPDLEVVDLRPKSLSDLARVTGKVNDHTAGIDEVDMKTLRLEPARQGVEILLRDTESVSEFPRREPLVKVLGLGIVELLDELLKGLLLLGRAVQLEQHVLEARIVCNRAAIVSDLRFVARVACKRDEFFFVYVLHDAGARVPPDVSRLGIGKRNGEYKCLENDEEQRKPRLSKHSFPQ
ncbi:MAG TPA: hypothetical protein VKG01_10045 [Thermoanaerobaculia bacterium]|nr:hypothetical protein [Thermoanaerobaculia bacterium]